MTNEKKKLWKERIRRAGSKINSLMETLSSFLQIFVILMVIFICTQAISFCIIYLQLLRSDEICMLLFKYINIWGILEGGKITNYDIYIHFDDIKMRIEFLMNAAVALSGILLSVVTVIAFLKKNVDFRRKSSFKKMEIISTGDDDIKIMESYFDGASFVAVYSHTFTWLTKNETIKSQLSDLAQKNKLKLYTSDDIDQVKDRLKKADSKLVECLKKADVQLRFSYIERNNARYILYRQEEQKEKVHIYIIRVRETSESKYLLEAISQLIRSSE